MNITGLNRRLQQLMRPDTSREERDRARANRNKIADAKPSNPLDEIAKKAGEAAQDLVDAGRKAGGKPLKDAAGIAGNSADWMEGAAERFRQESDRILGTPAAAALLPGPAGPVLATLTSALDYGLTAMASLLGESSAIAGGEKTLAEGWMAQRDATAAADDRQEARLDEAAGRSGAGLMKFAEQASRRARASKEAVGGVCEQALDAARRHLETARDGAAENTADVLRTVGRGLSDIRGRMDRLYDRALRVGSEAPGALAEQATRASERIGRDVDRLLDLLSSSRASRPEAETARAESESGPSRYAHDDFKTRVTAIRDAGQALAGALRDVASATGGAPELRESLERMLGGRPRKA